MNAYHAEVLAKQLIKQHGLYLWFFEFTDWTYTFGRCSYRDCTIYLSRPLTVLNTEEEVKDVILHEIAHALTKGHHHDKVWKAKCVEIGARPERCYSVKTVTQPDLRYVATCTKCGTVHKRARKPDSVSLYSCDCQKGKRHKKRTYLKYVDTKKQTNGQVISH